MADTTVSGPFGTLRIEREHIDVTTMGDYQKPDPDWDFIDAAGHAHRWVGYEVSETKAVVDYEWWCDDCRDLHSETHVECIHCHERIHPGTVPEAPRHWLPLPARYYLNDEPIEADQAQAVMMKWFGHD